MPERFESQFQRVVGGSEGEKQKGLQKYEKLLNSSSDDLEQKYRRLELKKSEKDLAAIRETEKAVDEMVREWGGDPKLVSPDKVHIVETGSVEKISTQDSREAFHASVGQYVVIEKGISDIRFRNVLAHEFFHQKSYRSAQVYGRRRMLGDYLFQRRGTKPHRMGLSMVDRKNPTAQPGEDDVYFSNLEEAVVATSDHIFLTRYLRKDPRYTEAFTRAEKVKAWAERIAEKFSKEMPKDIKTRLKLFKYIYALEGTGAEELVAMLEGPESDGYKLGFLHGRIKELYKEKSILYANRIPETEAMDELIDELVIKSNGTIGTKEEVFGMFARANYSGNLLTLGKTIEKILGKGAFRQIADKFKKVGKKRGKVELFKELIGFDDLIAILKDMFDKQSANKTKYLR